MSVEGTCLGTREIQLEISHCNDSELQNGMVAVFSLKGLRNSSIARFSDSNEHDNCRSIGQRDAYDAGGGNFDLDLLLTNGSMVFHGRMELDDVKIKVSTTNKSSLNIQEEKMKKIASYIVEQPSDVSILYQCLNEKDDNITKHIHPDFGAHDYKDTVIVKMVIKQSIGSTVRIVWNGRLYYSRPKKKKEGLYQKQNNRRNHEKKLNNAMEFIRVLASELRASNDKIKQLHQDQLKLESQLLSWKETAEKLGGSWQEEKDSLLSRYLVLLNRVKGDLRSVQKELKEGKRKTRTHEKEPHDVQKKGRLVDYEDEHDLEVFDPEEARRLAMVSTLQRAKRTTSIGSKEEPQKKPRQSIGNPESYPIVAQLSSQSALISQPDESSNSFHEYKFKESQVSIDQSQSSIRKNPHTGAFEMWSAESIFTQEFSSRSGDSSKIDSESKQGKVKLEKQSHPKPSDETSFAADNAPYSFADTENISIQKKDDLGEEKATFKNNNEINEGVPDDEISSNCSEALF